MGNGQTTVRPGDAQSVTIHHGDGTVERVRVKRLIRNADGTVTAERYEADDVVYPTEAAAREATGWTGLVFTAEHMAEQARVWAWQQQVKYVNGEFENKPYEGLAEYLRACAAGDVDAAAREAERFEVAQGFTQYEGAWGADLRRVIVRMKGQVVTKSGRVLKKNDLGLARVEDDGTMTVFSATVGHNICVPARLVKIVAEDA